MNNGVVPSEAAWQRIGAAVRKVEGQDVNFQQSGRDPYYLFPAVVYRVTGPADANGYYPAMLLAWDTATEAWIDTEECYVVLSDGI